MFFICVLAINTFFTNSFFCIILELRDDPSSFECNFLSYSDTMPAMVQPQRNTPDFINNMTDFVREIGFFLSEKRRMQGRPDELQVMSSLELMEEKNAMQKQLLSLERKFGRPSSKQEKEIVRDLYDRYRSVKRLTSKALSSRDGVVDLVPIIENVPLELEDPADTVSNLKINSNSGKCSSPFMSRRSKSLDEIGEYNNRESISSCSTSSNSSNATDRANESFHDMNL